MRSKILLKLFSNFIKSITEENRTLKYPQNTFLLIESEHYFSIVILLRDFVLEFLDGVFDVLNLLIILGENLTLNCYWMSFPHI